MVSRRSMGSTAWYVARMWKRCCAIVSLLLLWATCALAQAPAVLLDPAREKISLAGHLEWLEDKDGHLDLTGVQTAPGWSALPMMPNAGYTRSAIWLRLTLIQPPGRESSWRLGIDDSQIDEVRLYRSQHDEVQQRQQAGRLIPRHHWPLAARYPVFTLQLTPGTHTVYLRVQNQHPIAFPLHLYTSDGYQRQTDREALAYGLFFGIFATVILLQLLFVALYRDRLSIWHLVYTLTLLTATQLRSGYPQLLLVAPDQLIDIHWLIAFTILAPLSIARLTAVWLNLRRHLPRINRFYQGGTYAMGLLTMGVALLHQPALGIEINQLMTLGILMTSLGIGLWLWRRRAPNAGSYLLVFGLLDLGVFARFMRNLGWLPVNFFTDYAIFIGIALHLLLMSLFFIYRHRQLEQTLEVERRAREEQKDFVAMVSHEFRTPLAIINTSIQQLAANLDAPAEKSLQRAQNIRTAVQRMTLLLDDYLSLDRFDSVHQPIRRTACDFYEVIEDAASDWPLDQVRITLHDLPARWVCDPDLMRIVLRNLLTNAVRHSSTGRPVELEATGLPNGGVRLRVQDHGDGIPSDELSRLFQKYFRGRAAQGKPGAGLGLYLVKRIVEGHGGTIDVRSALGAGTTFVVSLPATPPNQ